MSGDSDDDAQGAASPAGHGVTTTGMDWKDRIAHLMDRAGQDDDPTIAEKEAASFRFETYRDILNDCTASAWLLSSLKRRLALRGVLPSIMQQTRQGVLEALRTDCNAENTHNSQKGRQQRVSRRRNPTQDDATFNLQWSPIEFCEREFTDDESPDMIFRVITVTGEGSTLQALPCEDYVLQVWPQGGPKLLDLIRSLTREPDRSHEGTNHLLEPAQ